ncbi:hypothetical protein RclHR1_03340003 [Rhizophagus clarus]|uniref:Uncharacterized protein n=1 Tax=Rhizophagus clarus TaxID=94130 RepID=A0A2Z6RD08_9GLOM|nr:hypothetical protein RclHR1_03340003 [Rhizophagus clarus]
MTRLLELRHDWTFGIKCCQMKSMTGLLELNVADEKHDRTFGIKVREVLPDEKHDQTFGIKVREVLPNEKHDWTFEIKCYQMKSMTRLLELSVTG